MITGNFFLIKVYSQEENKWTFLDPRWKRLETRENEHLPLKSSFCGFLLQHNKFFFDTLETIYLIGKKIVGRVDVHPLSSFADDWPRWNSGPVKIPFWKIERATWPRNRTRHVAEIESFHFTRIWLALSDQWYASTHAPNKICHAQ